MSSANAELQPRVLVVEDNPMDVYLIRLALKECGFCEEPIVVDDGVPALALLRKEGSYQDAVPPDLVILDLNLKRVDGHEVLEHIRNSSELENVVVAILSSSPQDVMRSKAAQADCFFYKISDLQGFLDVGKKLMDCYTAMRQPASSYLEMSRTAGEAE